MTPARLERATFGLGTPGTGSQAFPILPCSLESGEIRLNPPRCFSLSFPVFPHRHPKYIQSRRGFSGFSPLLCFRAKYGQSPAAPTVFHPVIFLFTGEQGEQYGYSDDFQTDGTYWYNGEGQVGDM